VRLAIEFLAPEDRQILILRLWRELPLAEIGAQLQVSVKAAHMRFVRAMPRLAAKVQALRARQLGDLLLDSGDGRS
jgi:DNA-directed RNA polymerase specialized sigma24 family protein